METNTKQYIDSKEINRYSIITIVLYIISIFFGAYFVKQVVTDKSAGIYFLITIILLTVSMLMYAFKLNSFAAKRLAENFHTSTQNIVIKIFKIFIIPVAVIWAFFLMIILGAIISPSNTDTKDVSATETSATTTVTDAAPTTTSVTTTAVTTTAVTTTAVTTTVNTTITTTTATPKTKLTETTTVTEATTEETAPPEEYYVEEAETEYVEVVPEPEPEEDVDPNTLITIYITPTGKKYHYDGSCNGGTYIESTLAEALARGLTPCKKCAGG